MDILLLCVGLNQNHKVKVLGLRPKGVGQAQAKHTPMPCGTHRILMDTVKHKMIDSVIKTIDMHFLSRIFMDMVKKELFKYQLGV